ncbi:MAG TPA: WG repeat-containing protein [Terriglobales bacterium]|nr:WG repeat-containing protein [Terriglobales bacterium]
MRKVVGMMALVVPLVLFCVSGWGQSQGSVAAQLGNVDRFFDGLRIVTQKDGRCGYVDAAGKLAIPARFTYCGVFSEGLAGVQFNNRMGTNMNYGVIDRQGKIVIPARFQYVGEFVEGIAPARKDRRGKCGYIDHRGKWAIKPAFQLCEPISEGMAAVQVGNAPSKCGYINARGTVAVPFDFWHCESFHDGAAHVGVYVDAQEGIVADAVVRKSVRRIMCLSGETGPPAEPPDWYPRLRWGQINLSGSWLIWPRSRDPYP